MSTIKKATKQPCSDVIKLSKVHTAQRIFTQTANADRQQHSKTRGD
ncbi:hypothetical protein l11_18460 [Neisseria weaveri LMG 5135]|nr:hypothetical protein l11_18460 [Neisseria weaveri LMG 5135]